MKVRFINAQDLEEGLKYVLPDLAIENAADAEISIIAQKTEDLVGPYALHDFYHG